MVFATYVFGMTSVVLLRRSSATNGKDTNLKLPQTATEWLVLAFTNSRFIGWGWERPMTRLAETRCAFLWRFAKDLVGALVALDACHAYFASNAWFSNDAPVHGIRLATLPIWEQAANALVWGVYAYVLWFLPYTILALVTVTTRICGPEDYPVLCAPFSEAYSVSRFWGKVWHQSHRNIYLALGDAICNFLWGRQYRPLAAKYVKVATAFGISAVVHAAGSLALRPHPVTGTRECSGALLFFVLQAIGVAFENAVCDQLRLRAPRWMGYVWVLAWGCTTLVLSGWLDEMVSRQSIAPADSAFLHIARTLF
ncbi:hypothetical protein EXIGLDRAFT_726866 [Exidia glandulosa HHB12029]|uniref:Wax synthase domain-containing protein n=1 Tax=Exidia glandulosa HHB12029 TaxID=1314781 RepID=A0A165ZPN2_EXIGL|nr:hypothetical protein EXIGLDRAFT_726866 [Exidia glandulosa HHB12029]